MITPPKPPTKLGRFEVGAKIGGGGMATVYLGRDIREDGSEELVALKVMKDELANDEQFNLMFEDEAKILARLSHPNVIQTLEYGTDGNSFIAMELLNGRTVSDAYDSLVAEGEKFELATAAWICARVAEGLHSAHELVDEEGAPLSVIHRDVNPTNIFLTHHGEVKLIDFGLARARVRMSKSAEGIVKGKIPYLAPEQAQGQTIDRRIDVYALGTTLWEMCAMKRLFKRDNDVDTLKAIRDCHVPDLRERDTTFPEQLWKIIDLALKIDRDERYATAEEMRTDLDAFARTSGPHGPKVTALLAKLFPTAEAKQEQWLRDAAATRKGTMTPPAPVPIASSSGIDDEKAKAALGKPLPPPERKHEDDAPPESKAPTSRRISVRPPQRKSSVPPPKLDEEEAPKVSQADTPTVRRNKLKRRATAAKPAAPPPEDKRKLWMIVGGAVLVLLVMAILASR